MENGKLVVPFHGKKICSACGKPLTPQTTVYMAGQAFCFQCARASFAKQEEKKPKGYSRTVVYLVAGICPPLALYFLWRSPDFSKGERIGCTAAVALYVAYLVGAIWVVLSFFTGRLGAFRLPL